MTDQSSDHLPVVLAVIAAAILLAIGAYVFTRGTGSNGNSDAEKAVASSGISASERAKTEAVVRAYILAHPEIIPEAMAVLQKRESVKRLSQAGSGVAKPFPGAEAGNPNGDVTVVEFTDYNCGFCKSSVADLAKLAAEDKNIRVVFREVPVLAPSSRDAALWALAAANQGRHNAFHLAMFEIGRPDDRTIREAAAQAGMDIAAAERFIISKEASAELENNKALMQQIGFNGTPTFIIGDQIIEGALGYDTLKQAVKKAREKRRTT
jgi:protein-disulfide isomerase